jgi:cytochrome P450
MSIPVTPPGPTWRSERHRSLGERLELLSRGPIPLIRDRFDTYGDLYHVAGARGAPGTYVLRHPDHIREVLVTRGQSFHKRSRDLAPFVGEGLFTSNGELWRRQRRLVQPALHQKEIHRYGPAMVDQTQAALARWRDGEVRELDRDMMALTLGVVCKALLDHDIADDADEVAEAMAVLQETVGAVDPLPDWVPTPLHRKRRAAVERLDAIIYPMIDRAHAAAPDSLLARLWQATDEEGRMSRRQLRDELVTLFLAGHETTAVTMTWALLQLAEHPEDEAALHAELDHVLGDRAPGFEDLEALVVTKLAVQETLRLFPPIYIYPRVAIEDVQIAGYDVPAGSELVLWVYFCHRDPRWFPNPDAFVLGRFLPESGGVRHPHAWIPFGAGSRVCVGGHFAMAEATLILASIAQRFRLRPVSERRVAMNPRATLAPVGPVRMRLEAR